MAASAKCKLCRALNCDTADRSYKSKEEMDLHVETHRQHLRLITSGKNSVTPEGLFRSCFSAKPGSEDRIEQPAGNKAITREKDQ